MAKITRATTTDGIHYDVDSFLKVGGKIAHLREGKRIVTLAFAQNGFGSICVGHTIFRKSKGSNWNKKQHVQTAIHRCMNSPIWLRDDAAWTGRERTAAVRKALVRKET